MRLIPSAALFSAFVLVSGLAHADTTLSLLIDSNQEIVDTFDALTAAYSAAHPDVTFDIETRPSGSDGDNVIKTRLSTGDMADIFEYNSGSLFQVLNPEKTLADLSDIQDDVIDSYKPTVTSPDGVVRGIPLGAAMGGGILYSIPLYKELGLSIPKTWAEFMANNEKIKAAGKIPVMQTYGDPWTSQLLVLADYFNVQKLNPNFAADYTANRAKYATTPGALAGFQRLEELSKAGYLNEDYGSAKFDDGVSQVATGAAAHYPMLTFAMGNIKQNFPEHLNDVGFFAQPGDDAATNGMTTWMPVAVYVSQTSTQQDAAKDFLRFIASPEGCQVMMDKVGAAGPYLIKNCALPDDAPQAVKDMLPYFQGQDTTAPALEFISPIKGPNLQQITVEVGSGMRSAADAAALYDQDVEKQAKQMGLPNW